MAVLLLILKIIGISLLAIIGLVILALCIPLFVYIKYEDELLIDVRVLFIRFRVHPKQESDGKDSFVQKLWNKLTGKTKETETEEKTESAEKSKFRELFSDRGASGAIEFLWEILKLVCGRFAKVMRGAVVSKFNLDLEIVGEDAADTALRYGKLCGVIYPALSLIFQNVRKYRHEINMRPNFNNEHEYDQVRIDAVLRFYPILAALHVAALLISILISEIRRQIAEKQPETIVNSN